MSPSQFQAGDGVRPLEAGGWVAIAIVIVACIIIQGLKICCDFVGLIRAALPPAL